MNKSLKILLLAGVFSLIGIFNFSSAYSLGSSYEVTCKNNSCRPVQISNDALGLKITGGDYSLCRGLTLTLKNLNYIKIPFPSGEYVFNVDNVKYVNLDCPSGVDGNLKFSILLPDPPIVEGGVSNFIPIITGLTNSINEFIPYVVYIGIGLLSVLISFFGIRYIINWLKNNVLSSFK